jgi:hypothetical protein
MPDVAINERPIVFSSPMIQAILAGRKTMTRRVMKSQPPANISSASCWADGMWRIDHEPVPNMLPDGQQLGNTVGIRVRCPCGRVGDRLWVRESWHPVAELSYCTGPEHIRFAASVGEAEWATTRWKPSIHMPRWASRITLEITGIKVERLQEIDEVDACLEGVLACEGSRVASFAGLWDRLNSKRGFGWTSNPWVWVVSFKRVEVEC